MSNPLIRAAVEISGSLLYNHLFVLFPSKSFIFMFHDLLEWKLTASCRCKAARLGNCGYTQKIHRSLC